MQTKITSLHIGKRRNEDQLTKEAANQQHCGLSEKRETKLREVNQSVEPWHYLPIRKKQKYE